MISIFKTRYGNPWYKNIDWGNAIIMGMLIGLFGTLIIFIAILGYNIVYVSSIELNTMSCLDIYEVIVGDSNVNINAEWEQIGVYYNALCK